MNLTPLQRAESLIRQGKFDVWFAKVDRAVGRIAGLGVLDLPDMDFWAMFDGGTTPAEAARELLENEGFPFEGDE